nr:hypothetical protein B0A51_00161 [Rachicladosporium sp. CCFEE 5018]
MELPLRTRAFAYTRLADPSTHIRLLSICQSKPGEKRKCRLKAYQIVKVPRYTAVSYCWGYPADQVDIIVNKARMTIGCNCEYVLQQASWYGGGLYWIDAICIDQSNDDEKASQVQMMGAIYRAAHNVLACVGPHVEAEKSAMLCQYLRDHESILRGFADKIQPGQGVAKFAEMQTGTAGAALLKKFAAVRYHSVLEVQEPVIPALLAMLQRTYFRRTWVAQELYMARKPALCCGADVCDLAASTGLLVYATYDEPYWDKTNRTRALETRRGTDIPMIPALVFRTRLEYRNRGGAFRKS